MNILESNGLIKHGILGMVVSRFLQAVNCYMYRNKKQYGQDPMKVVRSKTTFNSPLKWKEPAKVFTCSWSDFFIEEADTWRSEAWDIVRQTPHLTYQILTKRPERIMEHLPVDWPYPNVWIGVSIENEDSGSRSGMQGRIPNDLWIKEFPQNGVPLGMR